MKTNLLITLLAASLGAGTALATAKPVFYPGAPEQPRIQFLKSINGSSFFVSGNGFGNRFPGFENPTQKESDPILKPYGMAISKGQIFVCDAGSGTVKVFDLDKKYVTSFGGSKPGKMGMPLNIAVDSDGTRYVADAGLSKIMVYDSKNLFIKEIGDPKKMKATDILIEKGNLYVTDVLNSQIVVINPKTGTEISRFAQPGLEAGDLFKATNLAADNKGNLFVADTIGGKVSVFTDAGKFVRNYGSIGDMLGQFHRPKGVALDKENRLYAIDAAFENIQIFNEEGKLLLPFGEAGNTPGGLNMPAKVVIDYTNVSYFKDKVAPGYGVDYLIFVSNQFGDNKINVYGFLKPL